jgi:hypothetical protein
VSSQKNILEATCSVDCLPNGSKKGVAGKELAVFSGLKLFDPILLSLN